MHTNIKFDGMSASLFVEVYKSRVPPIRDQVNICSGFMHTDWKKSVFVCSNEPFRKIWLRRITTRAAKFEKNNVTMPHRGDREATISSKAILTLGLIVLSVTVSMMAVQRKRSGRGMSVYRIRDQNSFYCTRKLSQTVTCRKRETLMALVW